MSVVTANTSVLQRPDIRDYIHKDCGVYTAQYGDYALVARYGEIANVEDYFDYYKDAGIHIMSFSRNWTGSTDCKKEFYTDDPNEFIEQYATEEPAGYAQWMEFHNNDPSNMDLDEDGITEDDVRFYSLWENHESWLGDGICEIISDYTHSGTRIWIGVPNDQWDSSRSGLVYWSEKDIKKFYKEDTVTQEVYNDAMKMVHAAVEMWDSFIEGEVYNVAIYHYNTDDSEWQSMEEESIVIGDLREDVEDWSAFGTTEEYLDMYPKIQKYKGETNINGVKCKHYDFYTPTPEDWEKLLDTLEWND